MPDRSPTETTNLDIYGDAPLPWSRPHDLLETGGRQPGNSFFLSTAARRPTPQRRSGSRWHDGDLYFNSGPSARKARNLAANPASVISVSLEGIDLVLEGETTRVEDPDTLATVVAKFNEVGWPVKVEDGRLPRRSMPRQQAHRHGICIGSGSTRRSAWRRPSLTADALALR